jgi:ketosteroid isomerase-like protein
LYIRGVSEDRIEVVARACAAWGSGDLTVLHELYTSDVTADGGRLWFEHGHVISGVDAVVEGFATLIGAFERNELFPEGALAVDDTLVVPLLWRGLPPGTTSFVEQRLIGNFTFRDGRIAAMAWYPSVEEALEAVGLPPSAANEISPLDRPKVAGQS